MREINLILKRFFDVVASLIANCFVHDYSSFYNCSKLRFDWLRKDRRYSGKNG